ncbi:hypothetical protein CEE44_00715 [Candidatus Woesearchaeota archaeon B3_Woes]|nr:MAG: hypothetical protein CEE44_00715 [Candidatus Woesearchaeota archaeon B3_Woes]
MKLGNFLIFFLTISLVLSLYLASTDNLIFDLEFYKNYSNVDGADDIHKSLLGFFRDENEVPGVFNSKEKSHLEDVKEVIRNFKRFFVFLSLFNITLLSLLLFYSKEKLSKLLISSGVLSLVLPVPFIMFNFYNLFIKFHLIFFPQGNWRFPIDSTIISLFPRQFFYDATLNIILNSMMFGVIFLLIGVFLSRRSGD